MENGAIIAIVALVVIFGLGFMYFSSQPSMGSVYPWLNFSFNQSQPIVINNTVYQTQLCDAFQPYINELAAFYGIHPSVACAAGGGAWQCNGGHVGCYTYAPVVDCANPIYTHMIAQCAAYHATGVCDAHDAYCEYM